MAEETLEERIARLFKKEVKEEAQKEVKKELEISKFEESVNTFETLRAGRSEADIPLDDPYWEELNKHRQEFNK